MACLRWIDSIKQWLNRSPSQLVSSIPWTWEPRLFVRSRPFHTFHKRWSVWSSRCAVVNCDVGACIWIIPLDGWAPPSPCEQILPWALQTMQLYTMTACVSLASAKKLVNITIISCSLKLCNDSASTTTVQRFGLYIAWHIASIYISDVVLTCKTSIRIDCIQLGAKHGRAEERNEGCKTYYSKSEKSKVYEETFITVLTAGCYVKHVWSSTLCQKLSLH